MSGAGHGASTHLAALVAAKGIEAKSSSEGAQSDLMILMIMVVVIMIKPCLLELLLFRISCGGAKGTANDLGCT